MTISILPQEPQPPMSRENLAIPADKYVKYRDQKNAASTDNDRAAREREDTGVENRDFAYSESDSKHYDSKNHPR